MTMSTLDTILTGISIGGIISSIISFLRFRKKMEEIGSYIKLRNRKHGFMLIFVPFIVLILWHLFKLSGSPTDAEISFHSGKLIVLGVIFVFCLLAYFLERDTFLTADGLYVRMGRGGFRAAERFSYVLDGNDLTLYSEKGVLTEKYRIIKYPERVPDIIASYRKYDDYFKE